MQQASELLLGYSIVVSPYVTSNILFKAINIKWQPVMPDLTTLFWNDSRPCNGYLPVYWEHREETGTNAKQYFTQMLSK